MPGPSLAELYLLKVARDECGRRFQALDLAAEEYYSTQSAVHPCTDKTISIRTLEKLRKSSYRREQPFGSARSETQLEKLSKCCLQTNCQAVNQI